MLRCCRGHPGRVCPRRRGGGAPALCSFCARWSFAAPVDCEMLLVRDHGLSRREGPAPPHLQRPGRPRYGWRCQARSWANVAYVGATWRALGARDRAGSPAASWPKPDTYGDWRPCDQWAGDSGPSRWVVISTSLHSLPNTMNPPLDAPPWRGSVPAGTDAQRGPADEDA